MFWNKKKINLNEEPSNKPKIALIENGSNGTLINLIVKYSDCILVFAPRKRTDKEFSTDYNSYKDNKNNIINKDVISIENRSANIDDYVFIHKEDYKEYLKFKENSKKLNISLDQQVQIKNRYKELKSQRAVAKEFNISLSTCNKILNDKY